MTKAKGSRETVAVRLDPADRAALEAERKRRAEAGVVVDTSALMREAIRSTFGGGVQR